MSWPDGLLIAFLLLAFVLGWHQGFVRMVFKCLGSLGAIILTKLQYPAFAAWLSGRSFENDHGFSWLFGPLSMLVPASLRKQTLTDAAQYIYQSHLPRIVKTQLIQHLQGNAGSEVTLGQIPLLLGSIGTLFIGSFLIIHILLFITDSLFKLPLLNAGNKMAGGVLGVGEAVLLLWAFFAIAAALSWNQTAGFVNWLVQNSQGCHWLYENNGLLWLMKVYL